ncbi:MAG: hypothetical protein ACE5JR_12785 [Gemmatimonadota bacterium]
MHGVVFGDRARVLAGVRPGDPLLLIPEPAGSGVEQVWVHAAAGDPIGHLPDEIGGWLAPWMRHGGRALARTVKVGDASVPSWRRLVVEVTCG